LLAHPLTRTIANAISGNIKISFFMLNYWF